MPGIRNGEPGLCDRGKGVVLMMATQKLVLCTSNASKVAEFSRIIDRPLTMRRLDLDEIQALDPADVSRRKARQAYERIGTPVIVDDTGLHLTALDGFPGALVAWALKSGGPAVLHRMLPPGGSAEAVAITSIGYADGGCVTVFIGRVEGRVIAVPRGNNGFGFDPVFVPNGMDRSFAELSDDEKDAISPRKLACLQLRSFLEGSGD